MQSKATTVEQYLAELPADRREAIETVRRVILENLDSDFEEGMQYGMIGYFVPHRIFPDGYHCDPKQPLNFAALASQKNHMALYMMASYGDPEYSGWFEEAWAKTGKKLDMGKSCIRFKNVEQLALDVIGEAVRRVKAKDYMARYVAIRAAHEPKPRAEIAAAQEKKRQAAASAGSKKKAAPKKTASKGTPATAGSSGAKSGLRRNAGGAKGSTAGSRAKRATGTKRAAKKPKD